MIVCKKNGYSHEYPFFYATCTMLIISSFSFLITHSAPHGLATIDCQT